MLALRRRLARDVGLLAHGPALRVDEARLVVPGLHERLRESARGEAERPAMSNVPPEIAVRILRAKVGELEARVLRGEPDEWLAADMALLADLLADVIERVMEP